MPGEVEPAGAGEKQRPSPTLSDPPMELGLKLLTNQERQMAIEERRLEIEAVATWIFPGM